MYLKISCRISEKASELGIFGCLVSRHDGFSISLFEDLISFCCVFLVSSFAQFDTKPFTNSKFSKYKLICMKIN